MPTTAPTNIVATSFENMARAQLHTLLERSGKVIYSAADTLRPGDIYLLGINPGGVPDEPDSETIGQNLAKFPTKICNDYLDEYWPSRTRALQDNVKSLLFDLQYDVRQVCASNVVFTRSQREPRYKEFKLYASICWPVHAFVISVIRPRMILVFGKSPFWYLWESAGKPEMEQEPSGNYNKARKPTLCRSFRTDYANHKTVVVGIPHLTLGPAVTETIQFIKAR